MIFARNSGTSYFWLTLFSLCLIFTSGLARAQDEVDLDGLLQEAQTDIGAEDYAAAAKKLQQLTKAQADNGVAWQLLGYSLHLDGKLDEAIVAHKKATEFPQFKQLGFYNLGCAYSLKNQPEKSLEYLHIALDNGFDRFEMFESDSDLENVKQAEGFKAIQERVKNGGKRPKTQEFDTKPLVGEWTVTSGTRQGEDVAPERLPVITITAKDLTIPAGDDKFVMSYKVVKADQDMMEIDFRIESGPAPEGAALGIMKVDGNKAKLCYDPMGQKRPTEFKTTAENGCFMFVLEKKVPKFDASKMVGNWNVTEGTRAGEKVAEDRLAEAKITFDKDKITIPAGDDEFIMSYKIIAGTSPVEIDMKIESGPAPEGSAAKGIVKFEGDKFILCYHPEAGDRPAKFESTAENGCFLFTMEADKK